MNGLWGMDADIAENLEPWIEPFEEPENVYGGNNSYGMSLTMKGYIPPQPTIRFKQFSQQLTNQLNQIESNFNSWYAQQPTTPY